LVDPAAVAAALDGLRDRGATCQAYMRAGGSNVCVNAVNAGSEAWSRYSDAASRRAATGGRRMLPVIDCGEIDGRLWIAYDMGSATPLADLRGRRLLPTATSLRVLLDVARALDGAAAEGVFACDLPPDAVFLSGKGARLGDLGTAREALGGVEYELEGDPAYVPPEVLRGQRAGERSGVYLFGALMHYLLTGGPPQNARPGPPANGQPELPASIKAVVATATADDPERRPPSVSEAHDMARRALRGEPPARPRKQRPTKTGAAKRATAKHATLETPTAKHDSKPAAAKRAAAKRVTPKPEAAKPEAAKLEAAKLKAAKLEAAKLEAAKPPIRRRFAAKPVTSRRAVALFGALILGSAAGLLLAGSPEPEQARAQTVTAGGMSVTVPSGGHRVDSGDRTLLVQAPGSRLRARVVSRPLEPRPGALPVRLGALQAWRRAAEGLVRYSIPTSQGTLEVTCRTTSVPSPRPLRLCERTVSTLRLRDAKALPLAAATEDSRRLGVAVATLIAERDAARGRLGSAPTPNHQRLVAQELAEVHQRAAAVLHGLVGAEAIEAATRDAADAYARLAASAGSGLAARWDEASEQVRRGDRGLAEAIAATR
jgi:protein kinase-like protein